MYCYNCGIEYPENMVVCPKCKEEPFERLMRMVHDLQDKNRMLVQAAKCALADLEGLTELMQMSEGDHPAFETMQELQQAIQAATE